MRPSCEPRRIRKICASPINVTRGNPSIYQASRGIERAQAQDRSEVASSDRGSRGGNEIGNAAAHSRSGAGGRHSAPVGAGVRSAPWQQQRPARRRRVTAPAPVGARSRSSQPQTPTASRRPAPCVPPAAAAAMNSSERAACLNKDTPQGALIAACTAVIEAGREKPATMATIYVNRGDAYREKGELDAAIADFDQAINLDAQERRRLLRPRHGLSRQAASSTRRSPISIRRSRSIRRIRLMYSSRSHAYYEKRDYDRAIADLTQAIRLNPRYTLAIYNRGMAYRAKGEPDRAVPDFDLVIKTQAERRLRLSQPRPRLSRHARLRPRHPRLRPGDQAQSELHRGDQRPRPRLRVQGRDRPRHRGLRPGDPDQSQGRARLQQPRPRLSQQGRDRHARSTTTTRRS